MTTPTIAPGPTPRQARVLDAIRAHRAAHGRSPSYRELAKDLGFSGSNAVRVLVRPLTRKGLLRRGPPGAARTLVPADEPPRGASPAEPDLPRAQLAVWRAIRDSVDGRGVAPTIGEITESLGYRSPTSVVIALNALDGKGLVWRTPGVARGLTLIDPCRGGGEDRP